MNVKQSLTKGQRRFLSDCKSLLFLIGLAAFAGYIIVMALRFILGLSGMKEWTGWVASIMQYEMGILDDILAFGYLVMCAIPIILLVWLLCMAGYAICLFLIHRRGDAFLGQMAATAMRIITMVQMVLWSAVTIISLTILIAFIFGAAAYGTWVQIIFIAVIFLLCLVACVAGFYLYGLYQTVASVEKVLQKKTNALYIPTLFWVINLGLAVVVFLAPIISPPLVGAAINTVLSGSIGSSLQQVVGSVSLGMDWNVLQIIGGVFGGGALAIFSLFTTLYRRDFNVKDKKDSI